MLPTEPYSGGMALTLDKPQDFKAVCFGMFYLRHGKRYQFSCWLQRQKVICATNAISSSFFYIYIPFRKCTVFHAASQRQSFLQYCTCTVKLESKLQQRKRQCLIHVRFILSVFWIYMEMFEKLKKRKKKLFIFSNSASYYLKKN